MKRAVVFGAEWCGACHSLLGKMDASNMEYEYVDIQDDYSKYEKYTKLSDVQALPTVFIMDGAELAEVLRGNIGIEKVRQCLNTD